MDENRFGKVALKQRVPGTFTPEQLNKEGVGLFRDILFGSRKDSLWGIFTGEPTRTAYKSANELEAIFAVTGIADSDADARKVVDELRTNLVLADYRGLGSSYAQVVIQKVIQNGRELFQISAGSYDPLGGMM